MDFIINSGIWKYIVSNVFILIIVIGAALGVLGRMVFERRSSKRNGSRGDQLAAAVKYLADVVNVKSDIKNIYLKLDPVYLAVMGNGAPKNGLNYKVDRIFDRLEDDNKKADDLIRRFIKIERVVQSEFPEKFNG